MSDIAYTLFQHYGTAAERAAFTPDPPASGNPLYFWYESDTDDVYVYTTAWHQISSGLTGSSLFFDTGNSGIAFSASTSSNSTKGNEFIALESFTIISVWPKFTAVNGATYEVGVYEVNSSHVIQAVTALSDPETIANTNNEYREFSFASPVSIAAGTRYAVVLTRTDGAGNTAMSVSFQNSANARYNSAPVDSVGFVLLASASPIVTDTFTFSSTLGAITIKGAYA